MGNRFLRQARKACTNVNPVLANRIMYYALMKRPLHLKNPKTLNEKINWLKLHVFPKEERYTRCTDKVAVRGYVEEQGCGHLLPRLYGIWERGEDIEWDRLPDRFVLKCNHGCAYNILCRDKRVLDRAAAVKQLNRWLREDFSQVSCEPHYHAIPRKILCEEFLEEEILDYKIFCFGGKAAFFYVARNVDGDFHGTEISFFQPDGTPAEFHRLDHPPFRETLVLPDELPDMIQTAEKLAWDFPFVRVDLFNVGGRTYFSELTFSPCAGMMPLTPPGTDEQLGTYLDLSRYQT